MPRPPQSNDPGTGPMLSPPPGARRPLRGRGPGAKMLGPGKFGPAPMPVQGGPAGPPPPPPGLDPTAYGGPVGPGKDLWFDPTNSSWVPAGTPGAFEVPGEQAPPGLKAGGPPGPPPPGAVPGPPPEAVSGPGSFGPPGVRPGAPPPGARFPGRPVSGYRGRGRIGRMPPQGGFMPGGNMPAPGGNIPPQALAALMQRRAGTGFRPGA